MVAYSLTSSADTRSQVEELHDQAYHYIDRNLDSASYVTNRSLQLSIQNGLEWETANSYYILGYIFWEKSQLSKAIMMYLKSASILAELEDKRSVQTYLDVLINSCVILRKYSKHDEALDLYEKGITVARNYDLEPQYLDFIYNKAYCLRKTGDVEGAMDALKELSVLTSQKDRYWLHLKSYNLLGLLHKDVELYGKAREYFQYIINHREATQKDMALALHNIATTYCYQDSIWRAKEYLDRALIIKRELGGEPKYLFNTLYDLAEWHLENGELTRAIEFVNEAESLYPGLKKEPDDFEVFQLKSKILEKNGEFQSATLYVNKAYEEAVKFISEQESIIGELKSFQMDLIMAGFELEQKAEQEGDRVTFYQVLAGVGGLMILIILLTWKIWWNRLERVFSRTIHDLKYINNFPG